MVYYEINVLRRQKMANIDIEQERERLTNILSTQYSQSLIAIDEYERLLDFVNKTETNKEIEYIRKIIDTNETYALKATHIVKSENKLQIKNQQNNNIPVMFRSKLSKKRDVKEIKFISGTYELRLHDIDFPDNWLTLKLKIISGDIIIYIPYNVSVENSVRFYDGDMIMNNMANISNDEIKNKLVLTGTVMAGHLYIIYEK
jgi:hypothetical protein